MHQNPSTPASAADPLLSANAPVLRYDSAEKDHATAVEALTTPPRGDRIALEARRDQLPDVVYGRVARGRGGRTWLQYWFLYAGNPQDRGILRTGRHEGDWEVVQVGLDARKRPQTAVFAQHHWAEACRYGAIERRGGAPIVYVANGSGETYGRSGDDRLAATGSIDADRLTADGGEGDDLCKARTVANCEGTWQAR